MVAHFNDLITCVNQCSHGAHEVMGSFLSPLPHNMNNILRTPKNALECCSFNSEFVLTCTLPPPRLVSKMCARLWVVLTVKQVYVQITDIGLKKDLLTLSIVYTFANIFNNDDVDVDARKRSKNRIYTTNWKLGIETLCKSCHIHLSKELKISYFAKTQTRN